MIPPRVALPPRQGVRDCNSFGPGAIEAAVRLYGAERIVCGTDGTEFGCEWTSKALADAQIGEDGARHQNAAAMMSRLAGRAARNSRRVIPPGGERRKPGLNLVIPRFAQSSSCEHQK
jgi:hypothetical protein